MKKITLLIALILTLGSYAQTPGGGLTDIDGNNYNSVIIGTQEWTKENLNVSKYTDGTIIPEITDPTTWATLTTGAWCYYNNDPANGAIYGKLYNWFAVAGIHDNDPNTPNKILAPTGWHVPTDDDWSTLTTFLGGESVAGGKMKDIGTMHWISPNTGATNSSGFTGLPGGARNNTGSFDLVGNNGFWWSSSNNILYSPLIARYCNLRSGGGNFTRIEKEKALGLSVRCINDFTLKNQFFDGGAFKIYPNPAKDQITIDCGNQSNLIGWSYKIVNILGQEVINGQISAQQNIVQLNNIKGHGIYFVKTYDSSNKLMETKKIIIQQ
jgi:uncharacterized protein (TIGR02145 family)